MKTKRIKPAALLVFAAALMIALAAVLVALAAPRAYAVDDGLPFTAEHWTAVGGNAEKLNGTAALAVDKTADAGANKLLLRSKQPYANFRLTYRFRYESAAVDTPWLGNSGVLLHASENAASGYYLGFYEWEGNLWCSTGYYRDGAFVHMQGVDCGWGGQGLNEFNVEVLVKDGLANVLLNGWLFQAAPLPYTTEGGIAIVSDGVTASYGDFAVQPLAADYDLSSKLVRANWSGYNLAGDMFYWNRAGKNHTFRMRLPEGAETATAYYLARRTKVTDGNQSVDVYVDRTASLGLADAWGEKAVSWGDAENQCGHGNSMFGMNMVELPLSAFAGLRGGSEVGFLIDKNVEGWYSAAEYWLLYRDADGIPTVADYMDLAYGFDRTAHAFAFDATDSGEKGFHFICQNAGLLTARKRGEKARFVAEPTLEKLADISYTFQPGEGAQTFRAEDYVTLATNHIGCKLSFSVDGGAPQDTLTLPPADKEGTVVVSAAPDGSANDLSGAISFTPPTVTLTYRTERVLPARYLNKLSDVTLFATEAGSAVDLKDYVETNIEGAWSYAYNGATHAGTQFAVPYADTAGEITLTVTPAEGEAASVTLALSVKAYAMPAAVTLPYYAPCASAPGPEWLPLYGAVKAEGGKWLADAGNKWGVLADFGTEKYAFQTVAKFEGDGGAPGTFGFLVHAEVGPKGLSGLLVGLDFSGDQTATVGWLDNGAYTPLIEWSTYFNTSTEYFVKLVADGSYVELFINGYRAFHVMDKYNAGGKLAILNNGGTATYRDVKAVAFEGNPADYVYRTDWKGTDTFSKLAAWTDAFSLTLGLPQEAGATNFRLVRRSPLTAGQAAEVAVDGNSAGTWELTPGEGYGDTVFPLSGFTPAGNSAELTITPAPGQEFSASYLWLIYELNGKDYIADSVYFGHPADAQAHLLTNAGTVSAADKRFVPWDNALLVTFAPGEEAVWAREISVAGRMQQKVWRDEAVSASVSLPYRLYLPEGYDASKKYPLLLFMHGAGERGSDNFSHIVAGSVMGTELLLKRIILGAYANRFIVVAPQCPENLRWVEQDWTPGAYDFAATPQSVPSALTESLLYQEIFDGYSVDRSRVYGAGLSMGGFGITDLAMRRPGLFAAIVNCSGGADAAAYELLSTTAVRAYHSDSDTTVNNDALAALVNALKGAGGDAEYYEVNTIGHYSWQAGFEDADLLAWLLAHEKRWTVRVALDGGTLVQELPASYGYGQNEIILATPERSGYRFGGWFTDAALTNGIAAFSGATADNLTLYAKWVSDFSVKVIADGATLAELSLESGSVLDLSQYKPEKAGHRHIGWTDGTDDFPVNAKVTVTKNATYTAKWLAENFTVTVYDGTEAVYSETVAYGGSADFTPPEKTGYDFAGFFADAEFTRPAEFPEQISGAVTLYAKYVPHAYTVTLVYGEGERETAEAKYGESYTPPQVARDGYEFLGWFTDEALTNRAEAFTVTGDVTLYAAFRKTGLSGGAIAGIAVGCTAAAGCGAAAFFLLRRRRKIVK